jgi:hypothetical protein
MEVQLIWLASLYRLGGVLHMVCRARGRLDQCDRESTVSDCLSGFSRARLAFAATARLKLVLARISTARLTSPD